MSAYTRSDWQIPAALIALSAVPVLAGGIRLMQLSGGDISPENARFFAEPLSVALHIVSVTVYCLLGAFQFSPAFRRNNPEWHRSAGRLLVPLGLVAALSGIWMTLFYPAANYDGVAVFVARLLAGSAMVLFILLGLSAIRRRDVMHHRRWMMRSYAIGIAAGTQVFTHIPWFVFPDIQGEFARSVCMVAGWAINIAVVEWILAREHR